MTFSTSNSSSGIHMFTDDHNDISETQLLKDAIINHTKYGSTNHNSSESQNYRYINATQETVADFMVRIDSSIAKTKNQVEKMSQKNDVNSIEEELLRSTKRFSTPKLTTSDRSAISASASSRHSSFPIFDSDGNVPRVVNSNSNKRKVKSSLKRHAKNQEEIFEL